MAVGEEDAAAEPAALAARARAVAVALIAFRSAWIGLAAAALGCGGCRVPGRLLAGLAGDEDAGRAPAD